MNTRNNGNPCVFPVHFFNFCFRFNKTSTYFSSDKVSLMMVFMSDPEMQKIQILLTDRCISFIIHLKR